MIEYELPNKQDRHFMLATWSMDGPDEFQPLDVQSYNRGSIQVQGGLSQPVVMEGSNDGENFHVLWDMNANPVSLSGNGIEQVELVTRYIRPRVEGNQRVTVTLYATQR